MKYITSPNPKYKELKLIRDDESECTVNIFGYPLTPCPDYHATENDISDFLFHIKEKKPELILI
jgi:hypothetical protein